MGVMLQSGGVYPMLGPKRVLDLFAAYYSDPVPTDELLETVGLRAVAATPWRHLSGGEQQRLSLALALIGRPDVAFLDEPTSGVDPEGRVAIRAVVAGLKDKGVSVVLTTHELAEAERMADRIVILAKGRVVLEGTPRELATSGSDAAVAAVAFGAPSGLDTAALALSVGPSTNAAETTPGRYRIETTDQPGPALAAAVTAFLAERGVAMTDLVVGRTLEDVYFAAVGPDAATNDDRISEATTITRARRRGRRSRT
jgi:ABC-2 type transport system ATP-binding protein